jgi:hypothetical protein
MFTETEKLALVKGDRVAALQDGKIVKAYVQNVVADVVVEVSFTRDGGETVAFARNDVMFLYREQNGNVVAAMWQARTAAL